MNVRQGRAVDKLIQAAEEYCTEPAGNYIVDLFRQADEAQSQSQNRQKWGLGDLLGGLFNRRK